MSKEKQVLKINIPPTKYLTKRWVAQLQESGDRTNLLLLFVMFNGLEVLARFSAISISQPAIQDSIVPFVIGSLQDFVIAFQALFAVIAYRTLLPEGERSRGLDMFLVTYALTFSNFPACIDLLLQLDLLPRLNLAFIVMTWTNGSQFMSSFSAALSLQMLTAIAFLGVFYLMSLFLLGTNVVRVPVFKGGRRLRLLAFFGLTYVATGFCFYSYHMQDKTTNYIFTNTVLELEFDILESLFPEGKVSLEDVDPVSSPLSVGLEPLFPESKVSLKDVDPVSASPSVTERPSEATKVEKTPKSRDSPSKKPKARPNRKKNSLIADNEIFELDPTISTSSYPLLRRTLGYRGEKLFDVQVGEEEKLNVLSIKLESWRARDVGVLGKKNLAKKHKKSITPRFDDLSKDGILFENHYSAGTQTSRTVIESIFGMMPRMHTSTTLGSFGKVLSMIGLPQMLEAQGYSTAFASAVGLGWDNWNYFLRANGFNKLLDQDVFKERLRAQGKDIQSGSSWGLQDEDAYDVLFDEIKQHEEANESFYLDFYSISSHSPWKLPPGFKVPNLRPLVNDLNDKYLASVYYSDYCLGKFIDRMRAAGYMKNTIVLIQGDHGNGRFEHPKTPGAIDTFVWDEGNHIPMMLLADGRLKEHVGKVISQVTSQSDTMSTIADIIGIPETGMWQHGMGQSMMRKYENRKIMLQNPFHGGAYGVRVGKWKYSQRVGRPVVVYDMINDPKETRGVKLDTPGTPSSIQVAADLARVKRTCDYVNTLYARNALVPIDFDVTRHRHRE